MTRSQERVRFFLVTREARDVTLCSWQTKMAAVESVRFSARDTHGCRLLLGRREINEALR